MVATALRLETALLDWRGASTRRTDRCSIQQAEASKTACRKCTEGQQVQAWPAAREDRDTTVDSRLTDNRHQIINQFAASSRDDRSTPRSLSYYILHVCRESASFDDDRPVQTETGRGILL